MSAARSRHAALLAAARAGEKRSDEQEAVFAELRPRLDELANQKDAWASGLYWRTDLDAALAEASRRRVPVLSLRLLGQLDEDISCANSRFFRVLLDPDPRVRDTLRGRFVLHWRSVADVPRVTVEFSDGRRRERSVVGNSMHATLDPKGRVIDAMPGLVMTAAFARWLETLELLTVPGDPGASGGDTDAACVERHRDAMRLRLAGGGGTAIRRITRLAEAGYKDAVEAQSEAVRNAAAANERTATKRVIAQPVLRAMDEQTLIAALADTSTRERLAEQHRDEALLSIPSVALIERKEGPLSSQPRSIEQRLAEDTVENLDRLPPRIRRALHTGTYDPLDAEALVAAVYRDVFRMPLDDPWLGLSPDNARVAIDGRGERSAQHGAA